VIESGTCISQFNARCWQTLGPVTQLRQELHVYRLDAAEAVTPSGVICYCTIGTLHSWGSAAPFVRAGL
jgi:hypothetical protein